MTDYTAAQRTYGPTWSTPDSLRGTLIGTVGGAVLETPPPPVVTMTSPVAGAVVYKFSPLVFNVAAIGASAFAVIVVAIVFPSGRGELVSIDGNFTSQYSGSSRTGSLALFSYNVLRTNGWPQSPTLDVIAVDTDGVVSAL